MGAAFSCSGGAVERTVPNEIDEEEKTLTKLLAMKETSFPSNMLLLPEGFDQDPSENGEASEADEPPPSPGDRGDLDKPPHELMAGSSSSSSSFGGVLMTPSQRPRFPLEFFVSFSKFRVTQLAVALPSQDAVEEHTDGSAEFRKAQSRDNTSAIGRYFVLVNWAREVRRRTRTSALTDQPSFSDDLRFLWSAGGTETLEESGLVRIRLYREDQEGESPELVGSCSVSVRAMAIGPVHHNLCLVRKTREQVVGRIAFDCGVDQVCRLFVAPVRVLLGRAVATSLTAGPGADAEDESARTGSRAADAVSVSSDVLESFEWRLSFVITTRDGVEHELSSSWSPQCVDPVWDSLALEAMSSSAESSPSPKQPLLDVGLVESALRSVQRAGGSVSNSLRREVLPQFQLRTTEEALDRHHLRIVVHKRHRVSLDNHSNTSPVLSSVIDSQDTVFGESWLNFGQLFRHRLSSNRTLAGESVSPKRATANSSFLHGYLFQDVVYSQGTEQGTLQCVFVMQNHPVFHQLGTGVRTERGIERSAPLILGLLGDTSSRGPPANTSCATDSDVPAEIAAIAAEHRKLLDVLFGSAEGGTLMNALGSSAGPGFGQGMMSPRLMFGVGAFPEKVLHRLQDLLKQTPPLYANEKALRSGQRVLLDLGLQLSDWLGCCAYEEAGDVFGCLYLLLKRGELELNHVLPGLKHSAAAAAAAGGGSLPAKMVEEARKRLKKKQQDGTKPVVFRSKIVEATRSLFRGGSSLSVEEAEQILDVHEKFSNAREVIMLFNSVLFHILQRLDLLWSVHVAEPAVQERKIFSLMLVLLYFRLPGFRQEFLTAVLPPEEQASANAAVAKASGHGAAGAGGDADWGRDLDGAALEGNRYWTRSSSTSSSGNVYSGKLVLEWEGVHRSIEEYFGRDELSEDVRRLQYNEVYFSNNWRRLVHSRGGFFNFFVITWLRYVKNKVNNKGVDRVPGYLFFLKSVVLDLRYTRVKSDALIAACGGFVAIHNRLLPSFIQILWTRTAVSSQEAVYKSFVYLDYWFTVNKEYNQGILPDNFANKFFITGFFRVLQSDIALTVAQALWFIYKQFKNLSASVKEALVTLLIVDNGVRLLLHWHWLVRRVFQLLLVFQIAAEPRYNSSVRELFAILLPPKSAVAEAPAAPVAQMLRHLDSLRVGVSGSRDFESARSTPRLTVPADKQIYVHHAVESCGEIAKLLDSGAYKKDLPPLHVPLLLVAERDSEPTNN